MGHSFDLFCVESLSFLFLCLNRFLLAVLSQIKRLVSARKKKGIKNRIRTGMLMEPQRIPGIAIKFLKD